jgi:PAP_fibrillin
VKSEEHTKYLKMINIRILIQLCFVVLAVFCHVEAFNNYGFAQQLQSPSLTGVDFRHERTRRIGATTDVHPGEGTTKESKLSDKIREDIRTELLDLIALTPTNAPTPPRTTNEILKVIRELEALCPTPDEEVVSELGGNWELLWTSQDKTSDEWQLGPLRTWIK